MPVFVYVFGMQLFSRKTLAGFLGLSLCLVWQAPALAHPIPDVPVRAWFGSDGSARFEVELDLRCFVEDPLYEPYIVNATIQAMDDAARAELMAPALPFFKKTANLHFDPAALAGTQAQFTAEFGKVGGGELNDAEDPVAVMLRWRTTIPDGANAYRLEALASGELSVLFLNHFDGIKQKRFQVLFPGETSKPLDLTNIAADAKAGAAPAAVAEESDEPSAGSVASEAAITAQPMVEDDEQVVKRDNRKSLIISAAIAVLLGGVGLALVKR